MSKEEIKEILKLHKEWLQDVTKGKCADLRGAKLQYVDLRSANLRYADLRGADLQYANLQYADLRDTDLRGADLQYADLRGADLDFSCLPLWCSGLDFKIDEKIAKQIAYHLVNLMQYSELNTKKIFKKEMYKWLSDSHLVTNHNQKVLEEKIK